MAAHADLVSDLKALRKGRGLFVNNVDERLGRTLRDFCGVTDQDGPGEIRNRVARRLEILASDLPDDLRMAVMAAFGMIADARHPLYQDRVGWIAERLGRDPRTARRRIDDGIDQLAQLACAKLRVRGRDERRDGVSPAGWHTSELRVTLALDRNPPEAFESHRIVSTQRDLAQIDLTMPVASGDRHGETPEPRAAVGVLHGGTLVRRRTATGNRFAARLAFPTPLDSSDVHDFALHTRFPDRRSTPLRLLYSPRRRCDFFELRVRFDRNRPPRSISRLCDLPREGTTRRGGHVEQVSIDLAGEIRLVFRDLTRDLVYGAQWEF